MSDKQDRGAPLDWVVEKIRSQMIAIAYLKDENERLREEINRRDATKEPPTAEGE